MAFALNCTTFILHIYEQVCFSCEITILQLFKNEENTTVLCPLDCSSIFCSAKTQHFSILFLASRRHFWIAHQLIFCASVTKQQKLRVEFLNRLCSGGDTLRFYLTKAHRTKKKTKTKTPQRSYPCCTKMYISCGSHWKNFYKSYNP